MGWMESLSCPSCHSGLKSLVGKSFDDAPPEIAEQKVPKNIVTSRQSELDFLERPLARTIPEDGTANAQILLGKGICCDSS